MQANWQVVALAIAVSFVTNQHRVLCPQMEGPFGELEQKESPGHCQELCDSLESLSEVRE